MANSIFSCVELGLPIEVAELTRKFLADVFVEKANLGFATYKTNEGKTWLPSVLKEAQIFMAKQDNVDHEYLSILGLSKLRKVATKLLLGSQCPLVANGLAFGLQTLSTTAALRLGAEFLVKVLNRKVAYYSHPSSDPGHESIFTSSGFLQVNTYRYWHSQKLAFDFHGLMDDLNDAPEGSVIVFQPHNPTGINPTDDQWNKMANLMEEKKLFPFFHCSYQVLTSGDLEEDAKIVRYFASRDFELFATQSFSKNLADEKVANLVVITKDQSTVKTIKSHMIQFVQANYCNPPARGCRIVEKILTDFNLYEQWKGDIKQMASRVIEMRTALRTKLQSIGTPGSWNHITDQVGLFSHTGLTLNQVSFLVSERHIYLPESGRINTSGLATKNIDYVTKSIKEAILVFPADV